MNKTDVKIRPIAIYLPQFHPIPENDQWWGKGFTEWTNVTKAKPLFKGHHQPHLPADLGFYDLRLPDVRAAQAALAAEHGIYGFCYYHYWFNGKRILERPFQEVFECGEPALPFMLCWANENWSRRWDGSEAEILIKQIHSDEDDLAHIQSLIPYFKDERYIKVDGKPVFAIYKSFLLPEVANTIKIWRTEALKHGIELYLCRFESFGNYGKEYVDKGFDAAIEFQPFSKILDGYINLVRPPVPPPGLLKRGVRKLLREGKKMFPYFDPENSVGNDKLKKLDYVEFVNYLIKTKSFTNNYVLYPGATPSWDNTARRGNKSFYFINANPTKFKEWLSFICKNFVPPTKDENFVFINAWNEWAEGCHLEPCQQWGTAYLCATKEIFKIK